jgi:putative addiction module component (TIGR02574 family)
LRNASGFMKKLGIDQLDVQQRLALIEDIWESIDAETLSAAQLSDAQRAEFEGRLLDDDLDDEDIFDLEQIEVALAYSRNRN